MTFLKPGQVVCRIAVGGYATSDPNIVVTPCDNGDGTWVITDERTGLRFPKFSWNTYQEAIEAAERVLAVVPSSEIVEGIKPEFKAALLRALRDGS